MELKDRVEQVVAKGTGLLQRGSAMPGEAEEAGNGEVATGIDISKMPGHWILARMGKRILRPGGRKMTASMVDGLDIDSSVDLVEFAPGLGGTTRVVLTKSPKSYTGIERDERAAHLVRELLSGPNQTCQVGMAQATDLDPESADVVFGEAFLTMQTEELKAKIVAEAFRILRPGGRYGVHELSLRPDGLPEADQAVVRSALSRSIRVGARPLTNAEWKTLVEEAGFEVEDEWSVHMGLLHPKRLLEDEGLARTLKVAFNVARNPAARKRILGMRSTFQEHEDNLGAIAFVARKPLNK